MTASGNICEHAFALGIPAVGLGLTGNPVVAHLDEQGSVRALSPVANPMQVTQTYQYDEFGNTIAGGTGGSIAQPFRYTGQMQDDETGLYYLRARYYDPGTGRFAQRDPVMGLPQSPGTLNRFSYVDHGPLNAADPSGYGAEPPLPPVAACPYAPNVGPGGIPASACTSPIQEKEKETIKRNRVTVTLQNTPGRGPTFRYAVDLAADNTRSGVTVAQAMNGLMQLKSLYVSRGLSREADIALASIAQTLSRYPPGGTDEIRGNFATGSFAMNRFHFDVDTREGHNFGA